MATGRPLLAVIVLAGLLSVAFPGIAALGQEEETLREEESFQSVSPPAEAPLDEEEPLDARAYAAGVEAQNRGDRGGAERRFRELFKTFPDSPYAPRAMLRVADMTYPAATWEQIGSASPEAITRASRLLLELAQRYRSSPEAARALVKLGYLGLEPANVEVDLDAACGRFATVSQVYPDSEAAPDAHFASGMCESLRDRPARAAEVFSRLLDEWPRSPLAAEALYRHGMALSRLDDPAEAVLALQQVRARHPQSPFAERALDRITLIHRMRLAPTLPGVLSVSSDGSFTGSETLFRLDPEYGAPLGGGADPSRALDGLSDIAIDPQGLAIVASPKSPGVFRLDKRGRVQERIDHPGPEFVAPGPGLRVYITGREQIAVNTRNWSGADLRGANDTAPRDFGPVALGTAGQVHMLDRRENVLLVYDRARRLTGLMRPSSLKKGRFVDVAEGADGGVFVLDDRALAVFEVRQGRVTSTIPLDNVGIEKPVALAVDGLGDLFVLDGRTDSVYLVNPDGELISVIQLSRAVRSRLGDASAVAVDARGQVYLTGRKSGEVVRFQ